MNITQVQDTVLITQTDDKNRGFVGEDNFSDDKFVEKIEEGLQPADAAVVAGYTGPNPDAFGERKRDELHTIFEKKTRMILKRIKPKKIEQATLVQLAQSAALMAKNSREEKSTDTVQKHAHLHVHVDVTKLSTEDLQRYLTEKSRTIGTE